MSIRHGFILVILGVVIIGYFFFQESIVRQLDTWKLLPKPQKITELYFKDAHNLPTTYSPHQLHKMQFVIHNVAEVPQSFTYVITARNENDTTTIELARGAQHSEPNQTQPIEVDITPLDMGARANLTIALISAEGTQQTINYWVTRK